jgi:hypothetical protein
MNEKSKTLLGDVRGFYCRRDALILEDALRMLS